MEQRALGGSDLRVSALGLGCWPLGGGDGWGAVDEQQAVATIHAALDHGINFFDTAEATTPAAARRWWARPWPIGATGR